MEKCFKEIAFDSKDKALAISRIQSRDLLLRYTLGKKKLIYKGLQVNLIRLLFLGGEALPIHIFSESQNLYEYNIIMLVRKDYHLLDMFNLAIRNLTENGIIRKLEQDNKIHSVGNIPFHYYIIVFICVICF